MTASTFQRRLNGVLAAALALIGLALALTATFAVIEGLSANLAPACRRLLPRLPEPPRLPRPTPWRIASCPPPSAH